MRRIIAGMTMFAVLVMMFLPICKAEASEGAPRYETVDNAVVRIFVDEYGILTCHGKCVVDSSKQVTVVVYLDQYVSNTGEWENIASWQQSGRIAVDTEGYYLYQTGCRYRARMYAYVYDSNNVLIETVYREKSIYC